MGATEQKRCLKSVFLTHRQMGICEAFMKILPEIRFKDSSIGTDFLVLGRREEMSRYLVRARVPENEEEELMKNCEKLFKIKERDGLYYEKPNWIEKFFRLGKALNDIFPAHLVKIYDPATKVMKYVNSEADDEKDSNDFDKANSVYSETVQKYGNEAKFHHFMTSTGVPGKMLPNIIELENPCPGEPRFLRKRKHSKALRFYKPDQENNPVRYFLQELMLYTSYDEKTYDDWHDDELCIKA